MSDQEKSEIRVGVFVCHCGGNISDVIDVKKVAAELSSHPLVAYSTDNVFMCSDPGQNLIVESIKEKNINRVVIAACSHSLHQTTFRKALERGGLNPYVYEHVNIREQDSWVHKSDPEGATQKAIRLVRAGVNKVSIQSPLTAPRVDSQSHILVIGAGIAGLRSALSLAQRGMKVTLIEKTPFLGGHLLQTDSLFPNEESTLELYQYYIHEIRLNPTITVYPYTVVKEVSGTLGNFVVTLHQQPRGVYQNDPDGMEKAVEVCPELTKDDFEEGLKRRKAIYKPHPASYPSAFAIDWATCTRCGKCVDALEKGSIRLNEPAQILSVNVGAMIVATGFQSYQPMEGELGYKKLPEVITLPQFNRLMQSIPSGAATLTHQNKPIRSVTMIHCVGSRQTEGVHVPQEDGTVNAYCSRYCCTATIHAALKAKDRFPDLQIYDVYRDIRTYGRGHEDYYERASKAGVTFFRMVDETIPEVTTNPHKGKKSPSPLTVKVQDVLTWGETLEIPTDMVVLSTGMMPHPIPSLIELFKMPVGIDRFLQEVHPKLRPVELANDGIFIAGTAQGPKDVEESVIASDAAAVRSSVLLSKGYITLDPYVASVNEMLCDGCEECYKECLYPGTIDMVTKDVHGKQVKVALVHSVLCKGCGACAAVCPQRAISLAGWTLDQMDAMIDGITQD